MTDEADARRVERDALWDLIAECRAIVRCSHDQRLIDRLREVMRRDETGRAEQ